MADGNVIWWKDFCGNASIYDAFWDDLLSINTTNPDLSNCFQKTALSWVTCGFLWLASAFYIPFLCRKSPGYPPVQISKLNHFKVIVGVLLVLLFVVDLLWFGICEFNAASDFNPAPADFVDTAVKILTFILATILTRWTYRLRIHSSGVLFFFWLLQLISGVVTFRSLIVQGIHEDKIVTHVTFFMRFALLVVSFVTCLFADVPRRRSTHLSEDSLLIQEVEDLPTNPCPKLEASFLSILFFWWFTPTIITGWKRTLTNDDIWNIQKEDSCEEIVPRFEENWEKERAKTAPQTRAPIGNDISNGLWQNQSRSMEKDFAGPLNRTEGKSDGQGGGESREQSKQIPSLRKALTSTFLGYYSLAGLLLLTYDMVAFINPIILNTLLDFVESKDPFVWHGYLLACGMFASSVVGVVCMHHHFNISYTTGLRVRTALTAAIYRKALKISPVSRKTVTTGEIVNLMSVDAQKCQDALAFMHYLWSSPVMIIVAVSLLWQILGPSAMAGVGFMILVLPLNSAVLANKIQQYQRKQMTLKDSRIKLMNQMLNGVKILKLYAWEPFFASRILDVREEELKVLKKSSMLNALTYIMWFCSSFVVALLCFATYVLSSPDHILDAQKAFVSMSLIMLLNMPMTILPPSINFTVQAMVSLKRIEKFLMQDDIDETNVRHDLRVDGALLVENGVFSWGSSIPTLKNINLRVKEGKLVAVVGHVGCGKSSLLSAILGEMQKESGRVNIKGTIAYVPQQAWIQNMTLRDNILFAKQFDNNRYDKVLDSCALRPDLAILPGGDSTEIGERGINLSGGQKQRISLARAVYQDADIYLLDDTLSAVDAHVGKHIFEQVIGPDGVLRNKTRILVTHGIGFLPKVDEIVVLKDGVMSESGTFEELLSHNGAFAEFIRTYLKESSEQEVEEEVKELQRRISITLPIDIIDSDSSASSASDARSGSMVRSRKRRSTVKSMDEKPVEVDKRIRLIEEEIAEEGAVKLSVLKSYLTSARIGYAVVAFLSLGCFIVTQVLTNIWLSMWTQDPVINGTQNKQLTDLRLGVYGGLGFAQTICVFGLASSIFLGGICASRNLHVTLLQNILKCPMSFFDTTPLGRIVNRFSKDIDILDTNIPQFSQNLMATFAPLVSTIIIIIYTTPIFVVVIVPLMIFFVIVQRVYVACARQIKRIDSIRRSPLYAFFSETLNGTSSIRAYRQQDRFIAHSDRLLDNSQKVWFESFTSNRWIGIWAEFTGDIIIFFTAIFAVLERNDLNPGLVGLSLSFALQINMCIIMSIRSSCELETYIVAVERIKEYSELENEAPWTIEGHHPPSNWPSDGCIQFKDYSTRYRQGLDLVLKEISCQVQPSEKIGIVGRTGAGKSSLTLALFRIIEAAHGYIDIDDININEIGLHDVRRNLTVIPQDPVIFSGSVRFNLDPSNSFTDSEIWQALEHAHLKNFIELLPDRIEHECGEDGENLSVGQRQLVCLARALLRKSKILVLDEATAAVDLETDDLIQSTIRMEFKDSTVITIAHRLNTIMDYDRVIVLSDGQIQEFQAPSVLLENKQSLFYAMAKDAGLV